MFHMLLLAAAATVAPEAPPSGEARTVIEAQLAAPPRTDAAGGVSAEEADAIRARLIGMIGKTLRDDRAPKVR